MKKDERIIVQMIQEICNEEDISFTSFSYDWILRLHKKQKIGFIFGYNFSLNNATSARICDDKCAASDVLLNIGIPTVEHFLFLRPENMNYIGESGNWNEIISLFKQYNVLVCKENIGTGGKAVFLVKNQAQLEVAIHYIFGYSRAVAVCPYYNILKEYRAIILDNKVKLMYAKNVPYVVGDGKKKIRQLLLEYMSINQVILKYEFDDEVLETILQKGDEYNIDWKSNLGLNAIPEIITDEKLYFDLSELALKTTRALSINFASVDMVKTSEGLKILEVNCGIMMENFIKSASKNYDIAKEIYREAVKLMIEK